jgi:hypothetical protein
MPGYLGGSSGSSGTGGEITFPKEFIDPVTKLRVSQPENLIDTDFEYGLQPTKWETVELINNTPSFFSKSGDTTIPNIVAISTNNGTREITVTTATEHGLAVGIPINVTGTKSVTADGSYVINSVPNLTSFTYLCKDEQLGNNAIEDLYSSIITGEFFQGSQIRISDSEGITTDAESISTLTVKTDSTHGFGLNTPFYFLNLNSTISQEFEAANTAAKSFDSSNSATAQTFDGSNTLSTFNIDWSNSATVAGVTSTISGVNTTNDTITVTHGTETFASQPLGTPLYYNLTSPASSGYFSTNPRGVVFLKTTTALNSPAGQSTFQVSEVPNGTTIDITSSMSGTFQLANQARTFAGNNVNAATQVDLTILRTNEVAFDGGNQGFAGAITTNTLCTAIGFTNDYILVSTTAGAGLDYYPGAMVKYTTTTSAASGLSNNATYFIHSIASGGTDLYQITVKAMPSDTAPLSPAPSGGSGTQRFVRIGVSPDKDIVHVRGASFTKGDMLEYSFPTNGQFTAAANQEKKFYFVEVAYDTHNYKISEAAFTPLSATGGTISTLVSEGRTWNVHAFTTVGTTNFVVSSGSTDELDVLVVAGGGGGGSHVPGGAGAGGLIYRPRRTTTAGTYAVVVGGGGLGSNNVGGYAGMPNATKGGNSSVFGLTAIGGSFGSSWDNDTRNLDGGSGGGLIGAHGIVRGLGTQPSQAGESGSFGFGNNGGAGNASFATTPYPTSGGGGAGAAGQAAPNINTAGNGGNGRFYGDVFGYTYGEQGYFAGGGGGGSWGLTQGGRGYGGVGGGGQGDSAASRDGGDGGSIRIGIGNNPIGEAGKPNTGGGGGGAGATGGLASRGGDGGSGIVLIRYPITPKNLSPTPMSATGGQSTTTITVGTGADAIQYRVHSFTNVGTSTFTINSVGDLTGGLVEYLVVGGGGGGATWVGGGGGAGGFRTGTLQMSAGSTTITVGNGGGNYENGSPSSIGSLIVSQGGGHGGGWDNGALTVWSIGSSGASSGGAGSVGDGVGGSNRTRVSPAAVSVAGQGNIGGTGIRFTTDNANAHNTGGGGGAGGVGVQGADINTSLAGRADGGVGRISNILGTPYYFAGGGGGSTITNCPGGNGGPGGGGGGHTWASNNPGTGGVGLNNGTNGGNGSGAGVGGRQGGNGGANTGGGGGGAYSTDGRSVGGRTIGGVGGSGIVVIRYQITSRVGV